MIIKAIEFIVKEGKIIPKVVFEDKEIFTTLKCISELNVGDDIKIGKKEEFCITKKNKTKLLLPSVCPSCGQRLKKVNDDLICFNIYGCKEQRKRLLEKWCKELKLKTLYKNVDNILNYFSLDKFILNRLQKLTLEKVIPFIYTLSQDDLAECCLKDDIFKIYKEIQDSVKNINLNVFLNVFKNDLTKKQKEEIITEFKSIKEFLYIQDRDRKILLKIVGQENMEKIKEFILNHTETMLLLQTLGISLE